MRISFTILAPLIACLLHANISTGEAPTKKALTPAEQTVIADVDKRVDELKAVNKAIWGYAEVGLQEFQSAALLTEKLEANGFQVTRGLSGMPTAFVASYGSGRPIIGVLAEYDALPELSQQVVDYRQPVQEGAPGHGCGHSGLGTGALGAALAAKAAMETHNLSGTIRLYGTPAEETVIGKVYMKLDGQFDDLDACLHWHPSDKNSAWGGSSKASTSVKFTFKGVASHSSGSPHSGRSALDAVELMNVAANYMREHIKEDARLHYVITNGGGQPNVVPAEATVWYFVRADKHTDVEYNFKWLTEIAEGAAKMTRTTLSIQVDTDCHELIPNSPLTEAIHANLVTLGAPQYTEEERIFAARLQEPLKEAFGQTFRTPINEGITSPMLGPTKGSTDVGDVSWAVPTGGVRITCFPAGSPGHSWQNTASIGSSIGEKGTVFAAKVLGVTMVQLLGDQDLIAAAKADFKKRMEGQTYTTLIPAGQSVPKAIR